LRLSAGMECQALSTTRQRSSACAFVSLSVGMAEQCTFDGTSLHPTSFRDESSASEPTKVCLDDNDRFLFTTLLTDCRPMACWVVCRYRKPACIVKPFRDAGSRLPHARVTQETRKFSDTNERDHYCPTPSTMSSRILSGIRYLQSIACSRTVLSCSYTT
jgi:hypothetical protein